MRFAIAVRIVALVLVVHLFFPGWAASCSTFMLNTGDHLIFGHNLNENGIDVPGLVFVNKRGVFKTGRTWSEIINKDRARPSDLTWISRYGSVTFNVFGRDFPDGGMNEAGLYIWEMSENAEYPRNDELPRLMHMNWMQFVLDNYSTIDQAIASAHEIEIDGWDWHFFVADGLGRSASIGFANGEVVVHRGQTMPVPALMNEPYDREMEVLRFFQGFGGDYPVELGSMYTPRMAKTAVMLRDYRLENDPVEYAVYMLDTLKVAETPKWSVVFDFTDQRVLFKTRLHPSIKEISLDAIDYSHATPVQIMNIDIAEGGPVDAQLHRYDDREVFDFLMALPLPDEFFGVGGLSRSEFCRRATGHWRDAEEATRQIYRGTWVEIDEAGERPSTAQPWTLEMDGDGNRVEGRISGPSEHPRKLNVDNLQMQGNRLAFTFREGPGGEIYEVRGTVREDQLEAHLYGIEDYYGALLFERVD